MQKMKLRNPVEKGKETDKEIEIEDDVKQSSIKIDRGKLAKEVMIKQIKSK
jgi:hypothetical protein